MNRKTLLGALCLVSIHSYANVSIIYKNSQWLLDASDIENVLATYCSLNECQHFNTQRIKKDRTLHEEAFNQENTHKISIAGAKGQLIEAFFVDRGADKVVLVGQGFYARKEYLVPFLKLFPDYDLLFFDYHGQQKKEVLWTYLKKGRAILDRYFVEPQNDIISLGAFLRSRKEYVAVIGLGMCYSGLVFCGAQASSTAQGKPLFDKLILDSSINCLQDVITQFFQDPCICVDSKQGGTPCFLQWFFSTRPVTCSAKALGYIFLGNQCSTIAMSTYVQQMQIPMLFIRATQDRLVSHESFMKIYDTADKDISCAVTFPVPHTLCHIKCKELYAHVAGEFIETSTTAEFVAKFDSHLKKAGPAV